MITKYPSIDPSTIMLISHIQSISKSLSLLVNHRLADYGLTEGKLYVIAYLLSEELLGNSDRSPSQIASHIGITRGTVTGLLDGLEREGYLIRTHDTKDRRGLTIGLTDKSRSFLDAFLPSVTGTLTEAIPLSTEEKQSLINSLGVIEEAVANLTPPAATGA